MASTRDKKRAKKLEWAQKGEALQRTFIACSGGAPCDDLEKVFQCELEKIQKAASPETTKQITLVGYAK